MRLATLGKILFFALLFLPAKQIFSQSSQPITNPNFLSVKTSFYEYSWRDFRWLKRHPDLATTVVTRLRFSENQTVDRGYRMDFPTLDIYSSAGLPLYFSDSPQVNLKVIDALPQALPKPNLNPRYKVRPSLRKALSMIPAIPRKDWPTPPQIDYTILSISLDPPNPNASPAQKKAILRQKKRATEGVHVIQSPDPHPKETQKLDRANQAANKAQEKAIQRLESRLKGSRIRVIEVRLQH